jgi:hypothetical protein
MTSPFLSGAICTGFLVISLFFLRFWRNTRDRLFLFFAAGFLLLTAERIVHLLWSTQSEWSPAIYLLRFCAFVFIAFAVYDKNRRK